MDEIYIYLYMMPIPLGIVIARKLEMPKGAEGGLPPSDFGPQLRRIREEKALTQKQVGDAASVHPNTIARLERGEVEPSWQMVIALAKALSVDCTAFNASPSEEQSVEEVKPEKPAPKKGGKK